MSALCTSFEPIKGTGGSFGETSQQTVKFHAYCTGDPNAHADAIYAHTDCPRYGERHPNWAQNRLIVESVRYREVGKGNHNRDGAFLYEVDVFYRSPEIRQFDSDPLAETAVWSGSTWMEVRVVEEDNEGNPIATKAGQIIEGVEEEFFYPKFSFRKKVASVPDWFLSYAGSVNNDTVTIGGLSFSPRTLKMGPVEFSEPVTYQYNGFSLQYLEITGSMFANPNTWDLQLLNRGTLQLAEVSRYYNGSNTTEGPFLIPCVDNEGNAATEKYFLDEDGKQITETVGGIVRPKATLVPDDIVTLTFKTKQEKAYASIPIF